MEEMKSIAKICKMGNSLTVTIPIQIVKLQELEEHDYVETSFKLIKKNKDMKEETKLDLPQL